MKTLETKLFSFKELSEESRARVLENQRESVWGDPDNFTLGECMDSLKAIAEACNVQLLDWSAGPDNRNNFVKTNSNLEGNKALASFANCLFENDYARTKHFKEIEFPGVCGFTGVCFDEDLAEEMLGALIEGESLNKAFNRAGDRIQQICEDDLQYRTSDEGILEYLDTEAEIYTEAGNEF